MSAREPIVPAPPAAASARPGDASADASVESSAKGPVEGSVDASLDAVQRHTLLEDAQAIFIGTLFMSLALVLFGQAGLMTGGTAGVAFLLHYATGWPLGLLFFVINLPFYGFAWRRMGAEFTLKTFVAITSLALMTQWSPQLFAIERLHPLYAAVLGGVLAGCGAIFLARHRTSLGGVTIVTLYLQRSRGWRAGKIQLVIDCAIVLLALWVVPPRQVATSVLAAVVMNLCIAINHRPGRYAVV